MSRRAAALVCALCACGGDKHETASAPNAASATASASASPAPTTSAAPTIALPVPARDHATLPCGDAVVDMQNPVESIYGVSMTRAQNDDVLVAVQSKSGYAYLASPRDVARIGVVSPGDRAAAVPGPGDLVLRRGGKLVACKPGQSVTLPESPHAARDAFVGAFVDGHAVLAVWVEVGTRGAPCKRLTGSTQVDKRAFVEELDLDAETPAWKNVATRALPAPPGAECRSSVAVASAAKKGSAVVVFESCVMVDAGDSISMDKCTIAAERFASGSWERFSLATPSDEFTHPVASRDAERVAVENRGRDAFVVYRLEHGAFVAEGAPVAGEPMAIDGGRLLRIEPRASRRGPSGLGFSLYVDELASGAWTTASDALETTSRAWAFDLSGPSPLAAVVDEKTTLVRVQTIANKRWSSFARITVP
jgi:hypothetical protein